MRATRARRAEFAPGSNSAPARFFDSPRQEEGETGGEGEQEGMVEQRNSPQSEGGEGGIIISWRLRDEIGESCTILIANPLSKGGKEKGERRGEGEEKKKDNPGHRRWHRRWKRRQQHHRPLHAPPSPPFAYPPSVVPPFHGLGREVVLLVTLIPCRSWCPLLRAKKLSPGSPESRVICLHEREQLPRNNRLSERADGK